MNPTSLRVTSGDAYTGERRLVVTVTNPNGTPVDLTGTDMTFVVSRRGETTPVFTKTLADGIEVTNLIGGIARITLAEADTAALGGPYRWELEVDDADGKLTLGGGPLYVAADLVGA